MMMSGGRAWWAALGATMLAGCHAERPAFAGSSDQHWSIAETIWPEGTPNDLVAAFAGGARERGCGVQRLEEPTRTWSRWGAIGRAGSLAETWLGAMAYCEGFDIAARVQGESVVVACGRPLPDERCRTIFREMVGVR